MPRFSIDEHGQLWDSQFTANGKEPVMSEYGALGVAELKSNQAFLNAATGKVLIAGLGIGMVLPLIRAQCTTIHVVEKYQEVVDLFTLHYPERLPLVDKLIIGDIHFYNPIENYDVIYVDTWATDVEVKDLVEVQGICNESTRMRLEAYLNPAGVSLKWWA